MHIAQHSCGSGAELRKTATGTIQVGLRPVQSEDPSALPAPAPARSSTSRGGGRGPGARGADPGHLHPGGHRMKLALTHEWSLPRCCGARRDPGKAPRRARPPAPRGGAPCCSRTPGTRRSWGGRSPLRRKGRVDPGRGKAPRPLTDPEAALRQVSWRSAGWRWRGAHAREAEDLRVSGGRSSPSGTPRRRVGANFAARPENGAQAPARHSVRGWCFGLHSKRGGTW